MRLDICIPCFNEEKIIATGAQQIMAYCQNNLPDLDWKIVFIINGSTDNSEKIARELSQDSPLIKYIVFQQPGRGRALKKYWLSSSADILCYMDSDLAVELNALKKLIEPLKNHQADLIIGNRYHKSSVIERSFIRGLTSRFYNLLARLILGHKQRDLQCGFKAISKQAFLKIANRIADPAWFFDTELVVWGEKKNLKIKDIPVNWQETRLGQRISKVTLVSDTIKFLKQLVKLRKKLKTSL